MEENAITPDTLHTWLEHPKKLEFLKEFAEKHTVKQAAKAAGISRYTHYYWLNAKGEEGDEYRRVFRELDDLIASVIDDEIYRRAVKGTLKPIFNDGVVCGHVREHHDTLLIFLAKARSPHKYRDNVSTVGLEELYADPLEGRNEDTAVDATSQE